MSDHQPQSDAASDTSLDKGSEPITSLTLGEHKVTLLGTAHVSKASADMVETLLDSGEYSDVAIELCPSRYNALINPDALAKMDLFKVIKEGKASMVTASLALGAYQQRMAEEMGIEPGAEMRRAIDVAENHQLPTHLIDREVGTTLKRIYANVPWWQRLGLISGLFASVVSREKVSEEEIERLKEGDMLESTFSQFAEQAQELYLPLIDERDQYMANRIGEILLASDKPIHLLVVIGAGHMKGIERYLAELKSKFTPPTEALSEQLSDHLASLDLLPVKRAWWKILPWLIVALVLVGFTLGFKESSDVGLQLVVYWVLINGGLSALGALIAGAHPLTVVTAFVAAPLTSLNPMVGAGMVTAAAELYLRKPQVGDFSALRKDTQRIWGWWKNRVARTLLIFILSTLGSAVGTYLAGYKIFDKLIQG